MSKGLGALTPGILSDASALEPRPEHQLDPHDGEVEIRVNDAHRREEFRTARAARVMVNGHFPELGPGALRLLHQLHADRAAAALQDETLKNRAADQAEVAVDVGDRQPERPPRRKAMEVPDEHAIRRIP